MNEEIVQFGQRSSMTGILHAPEAVSSLELPVIVFLNAGLIHRIGPNRIYVKMARQFARMGFYVLRVDSSGIGDSTPRRDNLPYEKSIVDDVQQTMDYVAESLHMSTFILIGHCSGAVSSLRAAAADERVVEVILLNAEGGDPEWVEFDHKRKQANYYQNYYGRTALLNRERWAKFLTGKASYRNIFRNVVHDVIWYKISTRLFSYKNQRAVQQPDAEMDPIRQQFIGFFHTVVNRSTEVTMIFPKDSTGIISLNNLLANDIDALEKSGKFNVVLLPDCDHLYTLQVMQQSLFKVITDRLNTVVELAPESGLI